MYMDYYVTLVLVMMNFVRWDIEKNGARDRELYREYNAYEIVGLVQC